MSEPRPFRVVVVDDSPLQGSLLRLLLERRFGEEVAVETYSDPAHGLAALSEETDLLLLDWQMPGMSGEEVLEEACRRGVPRKRVIISSSHPANRLHEVFDERGCLAVIEKGESAQHEAFMMILDGLVRRHREAWAARDRETPPERP